MKSGSSEVSIVLLSERADEVVDAVFLASRCYNFVVVGDQAMWPVPSGVRGTPVVRR